MFLKKASSLLPLSLLALTTVMVGCEQPAENVTPNVEPTPIDWTDTTQPNDQVVFETIGSEYKFQYKYMNESVVDDYRTNPIMANLVITFQDGSFLDAYTEELDADQNKIITDRYAQADLRFDLGGINLFEPTEVAGGLMQFVGGSLDGKVFQKTVVVNANNILVGAISGLVDNFIKSDAVPFLDSVKQERTYLDGVIYTLTPKENIVLSEVVLKEVSTLKSGKDIVEANIAALKEIREKALKQLLKK